MALLIVDIDVYKIFIAIFLFIVYIIIANWGMIL